MLDPRRHRPCAALSLFASLALACADPDEPVPDAGADDAGVTDAGRDGGPASDAGAEDAGVGADAGGGQDAGASDAGSGPDAAGADSGTLAVGRSLHSATLLQDGRVLVTGGLRARAGSQGVPLASAEIYDPSSGAFSATGNSMSSARHSHTATLLLDGRVLIAGGRATQSLSSSELFNPTSNTFSTSSTIVLRRSSHVAHRLPSGEVLLLAGFNEVSGALNSGEIYSPTQDVSRLLGGRLPRGTNLPALVELTDARLLIAGGHNGNSFDDAALFDPLSSSFSATGDMVRGRVRATALRLADGRVLLAAGSELNVPLDTVELYDPTAGSFGAAGVLLEAGGPRSGIRLDDDRVLFAGGYGQSWLGVEVYRVSTASSTPHASDASFLRRSQHTTTTLADGRVVLIGGSDMNGTSDRSELFDPSSETFSESGRMLSN